MGRLFHDQAAALPAELFGPASFHNGDYAFFYNNLKDNVAKRVAAYKANR